MLFKDCGEGAYVTRGGTLLLVTNSGVRVWVGTNSDVELADSCWDEFEVTRVVNENIPNGG